LSHGVDADPTAFSPGAAGRIESAASRRFWLLVSIALRARVAMPFGAGEVCGTSRGAAKRRRAALSFLAKRKRFAP
jgi:hypothetical protein